MSDLTAAATFVKVVDVLSGKRDMAIVSASSLLVGRDGAVGVVGLGLRDRASTRSTEAPHLRKALGEPSSVVELGDTGDLVEASGPLIGGKSRCRAHTGAAEHHHPERPAQQVSELVERVPIIAVHARCLHEIPPHVQAD